MINYSKHAIKKCHSIIISAFCIALLLWTSACTRCWAQAEKSSEIIKIGVLANRGKKICRNRWHATAYYLGSYIQGYNFKIIPLDFNEIVPAVKAKNIDFILTNPAMYAALEMNYGVSRIATLKNSRGNKTACRFGGVIFTRADRDDIKSCLDLKHKKLMAVNENSFGGWLVSLRYLLNKGIDPYSDISKLSFGGTLDAVVRAVLHGDVDAGTVRTDTLERMEQEGRIVLSSFKILHGSNEPHPDFPFLVTTRLYPEWPFARLPHVSLRLAEKVSIALMNLEPEYDAAIKARIAGWTIPLNYEQVHECLKILRYGPYKNFGKVTPLQVFKKYWPFILTVLLFVLSLLILSIRMISLNSRLKINMKNLDKANEEQKKLHSELLQAQKLEAVGQLAAGIAHEINTPMQYISSNLDFMKEAMDDISILMDSVIQEAEKMQGAGDVGKYGGRLMEAVDEADWEYLESELPAAINQSREGAESIRNIVKAMKEFSHPGSRTKQPEDLNDLIKTTVTISKNEWKYVSDVEFMPDPDLPAINCLRNEIGQVVLNMIVNSAHAIEKKLGSNPDGEKGHIILKTARDEQWAKILITDTGEGIPPDLQKKIFEPFFTTKEVGKGSGQGLAISYDVIVNKHNGDIEVESKPGAGTTFIIKLPL